MEWPDLQRPAMSLDVNCTRDEDQSMDDATMANFPIIPLIALVAASVSMLVAILALRRSRSNRQDRD